MGCGLWTFLFFSVSSIYFVSTECLFLEKLKLLNCANSFQWADLQIYGPRVEIIQISDSFLANFSVICKTVDFPLLKVIRFVKNELFFCEYIQEIEHCRQWEEFTVDTVCGVTSSIAPFSRSTSSLGQTTLKSGQSPRETTVRSKTTTLKWRQSPVTTTLNLVGTTSPVTTTLSLVGTTFKSTANETTARLTPDVKRQYIYWIVITTLGLIILGLVIGFITFSIYMRRTHIRRPPPNPYLDMEGNFEMEEF